MVSLPAAPAPGSRTARIAARLLGGLESVLGGLAALILLALLALVLVTVLLRYVFSTGIMGSEEAAIWLHVGLIAAGLPLVMNTPLAMRLDILTTRLSGRWRLAAQVVADAAAIVSALVLVFGSQRIAAMLGGVSPSVGLPEWIRFGFIGIGGALLLAIIVLRRISEERALSLGFALLLGAALYALPAFVTLAPALPPSAALALVAGLAFLAGASLPHALLAGAHLAIALGSPLPEQAIVSATVSGMSKFLLLAIPFFLLAGGLLAASGLFGRLVRLAGSLVGHRRAGLAQTTLLTSFLFSGASGSSIANAAFGAATFHPQLVRKGYPPDKAAAIVASTSVLDNVIPPSIAFLILAAATNLPVGPLLVGGLVAGSVMALCLATAIHLQAGQEARLPRAGAGERLSALKGALPVLGLGIIVVAGIRFGIVTTTEAAALAGLYALMLALAARLPGRSVRASFRQAGVEAAAIGLLIGTSAPFAHLLAIDDAGGLMRALSAGVDPGILVTLLGLCLVLLVVGLVLDIGAAILLFGPILLPIAVAAGVDPVHFGVIAVVALMIGGITPPVGILAYVVSGVTGVPAGAVFAALLPYVAALVVALVVLAGGAILL